MSDQSPAELRSAATSAAITKEIGTRLEQTLIDDMRALVEAEFGAEVWSAIEAAGLHLIGVDEWRGGAGGSWLDAQAALGVVAAGPFATTRTAAIAGLMARTTHQIFGALGFTQEHAVHRLTRRLWSWRDEVGRVEQRQRRSGENVFAAGSDQLWALLTGIGPAGAEPAEVLG